MTLNFKTFVEAEKRRLWDADDHRKRSVAKAAKFNSFKGIGQMDISDIGVRDVHQFFDHLNATGRSDTTIIRYGAMLTKVFRAAKRLKDIPEVPEFTTPRAAAEVRPMYFTKKQVLDMCDYFDDSHPEWWMRHWIIIGCKTGMRHGEILTITSETITSRESEAGTTHYEVYLAKTKALTDRRVAISTTARAALAALGDCPKRAHYDAHKFYRAWEEMRVDLLDGDARYVFHTTRHTFATDMANDLKAPISTIGNAMGHRSLKTTARYIKTKSEHQHALVEQL